MKIRRVGAESRYKDGQTDRHDEAILRTRLKMEVLNELKYTGTQFESTGERRQQILHYNKT